MVSSNVALHSASVLYILLPYIVTYSDSVVVLKAFIITMMAVVGLTIYTAQSTYDYSTWGAWYVAALYS